MIRFGLGQKAGFDNYSGCLKSIFKKYQSK